MEMNFRIWGKYTDDTLFDESFDTWADLTVFKNTLKETGKEISISSKEGIDEELLPTSLAWFLSDFLSMEECDISALNTSMVTTMDRVFYNTYNSGTTRGRLKKLDLSKNNLSKCTMYSHLLYNQQHITYANLSSLNFEIITSIASICQTLSFDLGVVLPKNMYAPLLKITNSAFHLVRDFVNIEALSTFNTKQPTCSFRYMFQDTKITNLDLSSLELLPTMNIGNIFNGANSLTEVLCKNQESADLLMASINKPERTQCYVLEKKEETTNLPDWVWDYGTPVEYLESTGSQYIDTGIVDENNVGEWETNLTISSSTATAGYILGAQISSYTNGGVGLFYHNQTIKGFSGSTVYAIDTGVGSLTEVNIAINATTLAVNGIEDTFSSTPYNVGSNVYFFAVNRANKPTIHATMITKYLKYSIANETLLHLIPLLDKSNRPCMFDLVSKQYYYNQGSEDEFLHGGIIPESNLSPEWLLRKKAAMMMAKKQIN